jgi:hypothetical protein
MTPAFGGQYSIQLSYWCSADDMIRISKACVHADTNVHDNAQKCC